MTSVGDEASRAESTSYENTALALEAGRVGTWTWDIASGRTVWDPNLEQLHGLPTGTFGGTFEDWYASLHPDDRDECVRRVEAALAARRPYVLLHRTRWLDGTTHWIECRGTVILDAGGEPTGTTGIAFDVTAHRQQVAAFSEELESGAHLVDTLQRALLPATLPSVERVTIATRYRSARGPGEIGGDWYASVPLDGDRLGVAIGDVAGHGLEAVADMAAARFGLRALAVSEPAPERVLEQLSRLVRIFEGDTMITALYGVLDPRRLSWTFANAGHCSPVVRQSDGQVAVLDAAPGPPLGYGTTYATHAVVLSPGATVVLYTDGLVERRHEPITAGLARLVDACADGPAKADDLCDFLLGRLVGDSRNEDDIAIAVLTVD
jgi:PAS domain S-box-containing protein